MVRLNILCGVCLFFSMAGLQAAESTDQSASENAGQENQVALEALRDPTTPLQMNVSQPQANIFSIFSTYKVSSILIRPNMKVAVINSRQVREGDVIGNAEVISIDKNSVTLQVAGEEQILELYGRTIKTLNKD